MPIHLFDRIFRNQVTRIEKGLYLLCLFLLLTSCTTQSYRVRASWSAPQKTTPTPHPLDSEFAELTANSQSKEPPAWSKAPTESAATVEPARIEPVAAQETKPIAKPQINETQLIFDFPVTYNSRVKKWIKFFQTSGRPTFRRWLERSTRFLPLIQSELKKENLPTDIAYLAMIESGFSTAAESHANALGIWQFIVPTANRYGLRTDWWIDERRDYEKATVAALKYMKDLFQQFGSWYLVAASYNMGENGVRRLIQRHRTNSFWDLADRSALPEETMNYVPKMLAAMLIAKAPALYGFRDLDYMVPLVYDTLEVPGGTDLVNLAKFLGVSAKALAEMNPELTKGFLPKDIENHRIRIPKGSRRAVAQFIEMRGL